MSDLVSILIFHTVPQLFFAGIFGVSSRASCFFFISGESIGMNESAKVAHHDASVVFTQK